MTSRGTTTANHGRSRKRSAASSSSTHKPPENPVLFLDEGLGRHVVTEALSAAGSRVEVHADHFRPGELDEVWLPEVAGRGWIVLAKDYRIRYRGLARQAIRRSGARVFVLKRSKDISGPEMARIFVNALPNIYRVSRGESPPFIAKIGKDGRVEVWWPERLKRRRRTRVRT